MPPRGCTFALVCLQDLDMALDVGAGPRSNLATHIEARQRVWPIAALRVVIGHIKKRAPIRRRLEAPVRGLPPLDGAWRSDGETD